MEELRNCYSLRCGYVTNEVLDRCPKCGGRLRSARVVKRLGWLQLVIGLFLVGLMSAVTFIVAPIMLQAGDIQDGSTFTGTAEQSQLILGVFGLVIVFGLAAVVSGLWQIMTGRRNRWIAIVMLGMFVVLVIAAKVLKTSLGT